MGDASKLTVVAALAARVLETAVRCGSTALRSASTV
jgi:hypothetical protein